MSDATPKKYRKKTVVVTAYRLTKHSNILTAGGNVLAQPGDWVVTEKDGAISVHGDDDFRAAYDLADGSPGSATYWGPYN